MQTKMHQRRSVQLTVVERRSAELTREVFNAMLHLPFERSQMQGFEDELQHTVPDQHRARRASRTVHNEGRRVRYDGSQVAVSREVERHQRICTRQHQEVDERIEDLARFHKKTWWNLRLLLKHHSSVLSLLTRPILSIRNPQV